MITNQTERLNFLQKNILISRFLDVQVKSFQDFFQLETKSDERGNEGL
jgi:DNA-directed RNA polymerase subunit beta